ncbi:MAG: type II toxin-antitoxin system HipA family toxin [Steroidobacteraceae bacterium]
MRKIRVHYRGWGESWPLGTLADDGTDLLFEYSAQALEQGLELSPLHLKLRPQAYGGFPVELSRLPGLIADCLPDGWGLLLMDRLFRRNGLDPRSLSPLDRLAFLGDRAMGALAFEPARSPELARAELQILDLARDVRTVIAGDDGAVLRELVLLGGPPHGARPKVLVHFDPDRRLINTCPMPHHRPLLVKFPAREEHKEVCAVEEVYSRIARACGLTVPDTWHFDLGPRLAAFGTARFDVERGLRVAVHTLAGALHADFRLPSAVDYTMLLRATRLFTRDEREVQQAYERAVFNVLFNNRDDHPKNISFRLGHDRLWRLAPCYDLTFNRGPGGEHQMDVCGEGRNITREHLLQLAKQGGLRSDSAASALDRFLEHAGLFQRLAKERKIRASTVKSIAAVIEGNRARLA